MPLNESQLIAFASDLQRALAGAAPEWTDSNTHDPGVTVLEVMAYAISDLQHRGYRLDDRARMLVARIADRAGQLAASTSGGGDDDCGPGLQRVNFVPGLMLGVDDFRVEQDYARHRLNRRNRWLHGPGIVSGLDVTVVRDADGSQVVIAPGLAFDAAGNEIFVNDPLVLALAANGNNLLVGLAYEERWCRNVPGGLLDVTGDTPTTQQTRIVETCRAVLTSAPDPDVLVVARLRQTRGRWRIDATFEALRASR
ncbi:MAG: hypothetical protein ACKVOX_03300 [Rhizobacter sp.]